MVRSVTIRRDLQLPISSLWAWDCDLAAFHEVGQASEPAPDDGRSWRGITGAIQVAAQAGYGGHVEGEVAGSAFAARRHCPVEEGALGFGKDYGWQGGWRPASEYGQPGYSPGHDAAERDAIGEAVGCGKPYVLDPTSGFQGLEKGLDIPA